MLGRLQILTPHRLTMISLPESVTGWGYRGLCNVVCSVLFIVCVRMTKNLVGISTLKQKIAGGTSCQMGVGKHANNDSGLSFW